ncbi:hypothetical protein Bbelb_369900 [Branchiostoma belcheri]|nr:hypothetical protein Bbelb_369900 [Branchiostoma belcheri]
MAIKGVLNIVYVPGHAGVYYNEVADKLAGIAVPFGDIKLTVPDVVDIIQKNCLSRHNGPTTWSMMRLEEKGIKRGEGGRVYLRGDSRRLMTQLKMGVITMNGLKTLLDMLEGGGPRCRWRQLSHLMRLVDAAGRQMRPPSARVFTLVFSTGQNGRSSHLQWTGRYDVITGNRCRWRQLSRLMRLVDAAGRQENSVLDPLLVACPVAATMEDCTAPTDANMTDTAEDNYSHVRGLAKEWRKRYLRAHQQREELETLLKRLEDERQMEKVQQEELEQRSRLDLEEKRRELDRQARRQS